MTPYPSTGLWKQMEAEDRIVHRDWDLYDTRHVVYRPKGMTPQQLEDGYWRAYRDFYRWSNIWRGGGRAGVAASGRCGAPGGCGAGGRDDAGPVRSCRGVSPPPPL
jgi:radical SAM superfamily enzyme YgiQ (UPF0313 family)